MPGHVQQLIYTESNSSGGGTCADVDWGVHWHHLTNAIEPSMCGGYAALCQIPFTTCYLIISVCPFSRHTHALLCTTGLFPELLHGWIPEKIIAGDKWSGVLQWYWLTVPKIMVRDRVSMVMVSNVRFRLGLVDLWNGRLSE